MRRKILWAGLGLAGVLAAVGATLALAPKARLFAYGAVHRVEQEFWKLVDPPKSVAALRPRLFDAATAATIGAPDADEHETIVAFVDYNCVFCRRQFREFEALAAQGRRFRVVLRHLPHSLDSIALAQAMLAARRQGGEAALHRAMSAGEGRVGPADLPRLAVAAGLDPDRLSADAASPEIEAQLDADVKLAWSLRVRGTPTLVIGEETLRSVRDADQLAALLRR